MTIIIVGKSQSQDPWCASQEWCERTFGLVGTAVIHIYTSEQSPQSFVVLINPVVAVSPVRENYRKQSLLQLCLLSVFWRGSVRRGDALGHVFM